MFDVVKIVRAFTRGDVVFIESDGPISDEHAKRFYEYVEGRLADTGVTVVLLGDRLRVAGREETTHALPDANN